MGGGTLQNPQTGEIESCDIEIHLMMINKIV